MLPRDVSFKAHAQAFAELSVDERTELLDRLRPLVAEAERDAALDEPDVLATLVRDAEPRDAMMRTGARGSRRLPVRPERACRLRTSRSASAQ